MDSFTANPWIVAIVVAALLALAAFLMATRSALTAASRARLLALDGTGAKAAIVNRLLENKERLVGALVIGGNVVRVALGAVLAVFFTAQGDWTGLVLAILVAAALSIVFGEALPRILAASRPEAVALAVARPAAWIVAVFGPVFAAIALVVRGALSLCGVRIDQLQPVKPHEELKDAVDLLHQGGGVVKSDRDMIGGLLDLQDLTVSDVMVHRTKMRAIDADQSPDAVVREALASPYTRMPLWRESPENIIGLLHAKDILRALDAAGGDPALVDLKSITLPPWFAPDTTALPDQLRAFLQKKTHFAFVIDEYGVVMGLVTLEDVLEVIVGDIKDEHDVAAPGVRPQRDGSVVVEGSAAIRDVNRVLDWKLPDDQATTIAGLIIHEARMIPEAGQVFTFHGFRFSVLRKQRNRITALKIAPLPREPIGGAASPVSQASAAP